MILYKYDNDGFIAAASYICGLNNKIEICDTTNENYIAIKRNDIDNIIIPRYEIVETIDTINNMFFQNYDFNNRVCYVFDENTIVYNEKYMSMFDRLLLSLSDIKCMVDIICTQDTVYELAKLCSKHNNVNIWVPFNRGNIGYYCNDVLYCNESTLNIENITLLDIIDDYIQKTNSNKIILSTRRHLDIHDTLVKKYSNIDIYYDLHIVEFSEKCVMTNEDVSDVYNVLKDKNVIVYLDGIKELISDDIQSLTTLAYPNEIASSVYNNIFKDNSILFEFYNTDIDYEVLEILCLVGLNVDIIAENDDIAKSIKNKISMDRRYSNIKTIHIKNNMPTVFNKLFYSKYRVYINNSNIDDVLKMANVIKTITVLESDTFLGIQNIIKIDMADKINTVKTIINAHGYLFNTKTYNQTECDHIQDFKNKWETFFHSV